MTTISSATAAAGAAAPSITNPNTRLGKQEFLKLLVAQLQNQDPMKPMEDREFVAQLAQFTSLESLENLNTQIAALTSTQGLSQASALIGKQVQAGLADGTVITGAVTAVRLQDGQPRLVINNQEVDISQVRSVTT